MREFLAKKIKREKKLNEITNPTEQVDSLIIYESPYRVRPELFGVYNEDNNIIYLVLEASPEKKEVSLNKFLALHMSHTGQSITEFYKDLSNSEEYNNLIKHIRQKSLRTRARLNYDH